MERRKKRVVICMDGTWQNLAWQAKEKDPITGKAVDRRTNISKIAQHTLPDDAGVEQIVFYSPGVGARTFVEKDKRMKYDGATGEGAEESIIAAYMFLSFNYEPGDEIFMFGFSRGAFCVRSLAGLIGRCGILKRKETALVRNALELYREKPTKDVLEKAARFRVEYSAAPVAGIDKVAIDDPKAIRINFLGVFETVVMRKTIIEYLGFKTKRHKFHDLKLGPHVRAARHAMALDERRNTLPITPWTNLAEFSAERGFDPHDPNAPYQQKWFVGAHGDVGGGESRELSAISRKWVLRGAVAAGLKLDEPVLPDGKREDPEFLRGEIEVIRSLRFLGLRDRTFPHPPDPNEGPQWRWIWQRETLAPKTIENLHVTCAARMLARKAPPNHYIPRALRRRLFKKLVNAEDAEFKRWYDDRTNEFWT